MRDVEEICNRFDKILKTKINPILLEIDAEKNDGATLDPVVPEAVFFQQLNDETINMSPFILYGITTETLQSRGGNSHSSEINFFVCIALSSTNLSDISKRLLRYSRALKKAILDAFEDLKVVLLGTGPITFQDSNTNNFSQGIGLEFSLSAAFEN